MQEDVYIIKTDNNKIIGKITTVIFTNVNIDGEPNLCYEVIDKDGNIVNIPLLYVEFGWYKLKRESRLIIETLK
jgi:hypothetical protein